MGLRPDFKGWYRKTYGCDPPMHEYQVKLLEQAYEAGFQQGVREQASYDPKWDAD